MKVMLAGHVMHVELALRDDAVGIVELGGFDRWVMSPVWIMNEGFAGIALILSMASSSVPSALGLAGLSKPTWLSLIWRKVMPGAARAACAESMMPSERGTPPVMVQSTPVPAQVMHSSTLRRLTPSP